jgi:dipeptidyl aminopeptidase/acylaminoacyl peptidase
MTSEILSRIEKIVKHPLYYLVGISRDRIVYISTVEDIVDLWTCDMEGRDRIRISYGGVFEVARPGKGDKNIFFTIDVMKGLEKHKIFMTDIEGTGVVEACEMTPLRIFGIAVKGDFIAYSGSTEMDIGLYIADAGGKAEKLFSSDKFFFVTDTDKNITVGFGSLYGNPRSYELLIYNHKTGEKRIYTPKEGSVNELPKIHDGKIIFASNYEGKKKIYIYDPVSDTINEPRYSYKDYQDYDITDYIDFGITHDNNIWFIGLSDARGYAFIDGKLVRHPLGTPGNLETYNGYIYLHFSTLREPQAIYRIGRDGEGWERIIGEDLPEDIRNMFGEVKIVSYKSYDDLDIPCIIFESNIEKPGPTVIVVHGGPWSYVGDYWRAFISSIVGMGFHVVAPNFRGSTGYGEEFRLLDIGDPGGGDLQDIIYARKYAVESGLASKVAIMGYSYGGYMTFLATVKEPDIWDCAVAGAGITDWEESYKLSDAIFKQFINILFDGKMDMLKERSAISYIENLKVPICIVHPQNDTRTPLKPVLNYCRKLLEMGKTFELHVMPDIGHVILKTDELVKIMYPSIVFLNKYLKGR